MIGHAASLYEQVFVREACVGVEVVGDLPSDIPSAPIRPRRLAAAMAARMRRS
jgi:hypothetical protein